MAELRLKVGSVNAADPSTYQDGDVIEGLNDNAISHCHCQILCDIHAVPFTGDGLRAADSLAETLLAATSEKRYARVSTSEVRVTNLFTGVVSVGPMPGLEDWLVRRRAHPRHRIFGVNGAEVWYGGYTDIADTRLTPVWNAIEERTGKRKADHATWPHSQAELAHQLVVPVDDFTHAEAGVLAQPLVEVIDGGKGDGRTALNVIQKRVHRVPYETIADLVGRVASIRNRAIPVDVRREIAPLSRAVDVRAKPEPAFSFAKRSANGPVLARGGVMRDVLLNRAQNRGNRN